MCQTLVRVGAIVEKKAFGAPEAREKWCQCVDEHTEMLSQEVKTNPRYNKLRMYFTSPEPDR